jgi:hypothetical protein
MGKRGDNQYPIQQDISNLVPNTNCPEEKWSIKISNKITGGAFGSLHKVKVSSKITASRVVFTLYLYKSLFVQKYCTSNKLKLTF